VNETKNDKPPAEPRNRPEELRLYSIGAFGLAVVSLFWIYAADNSVPTLLIPIGFAILGFVLRDRSKKLRAQGRD
jgi:hypothetical protein